MTTLTVTDRAQEALEFTIGAGGGETTFQLELNRAADFASDDSFVLSALAAGAHDIEGLPAGTVWYARARKTNGGNGPWTAIVTTATLAADEPGSYVGYSTLPAILVVPDTLPNENFSCAQSAAGSSVLNLLNDDPMSIHVATPAADAVVYEFRVLRPFDVVAMLGTLASEDVEWTIVSAESQAALTSSPNYTLGPQRFRASEGIGFRPSYHAFQKITPNADPWWRITISTDAPTWFARHLIIGTARSSINYTRGSGRGFLDLGTMQRNRFGTPDRAYGWRGRTIDFGLSWLPEAEFEAKWSDLDLLVGGTDPVLVLPNSQQNAYTHDRIGFGVITQARAENVRSSKWQKTLEIASIY